MTAFVRKMQTLVDLTEADLDAIHSLPYQTRSVGHHRDVIAAGETPTWVYVVAEGWAARYNLRPDGSRRITGFMLPGDFCGIHAVSGASMEHAIVAITDCTVARLDLRYVEEVVAASPTIGRALWRAKLVDEAILRMWLLNSYDAYRMLAHLVCELHTRLHAIGMADDGQFDVPLTQAQIGDALGITAVHTNRTIRQLHEAGIVEFQRQRVTVPDMGALRRAASFDASYLHGLAAQPA